MYMSYFRSNFQECSLSLFSQTLFIFIKNHEFSKNPEMQLLCINLIKSLLVIHVRIYSGSFSNDYNITTSTIERFYRRHAVLQHGHWIVQTKALVTNTLANAVRTIFDRCVNGQKSFVRRS